jgi:quinol monooxygenase YgiN
MIIVNGAVTARAESFEILLEASLDHVARSRQERGCISHSVHLDCEDPLRLVFFEEWADRDALDAHFKQPASAMFMAAVRDLAIDRAPVRIYEAAIATRS